MFIYLWEISYAVGKATYLLFKPRADDSLWVGITVEVCCVDEIAPKFCISVHDFVGSFLI